MTKKAKIIAALEAGWTDLETMWTALERENPHLSWSWTYVCKVAKEWRVNQELMEWRTQKRLATATVVKLERKK